MNRRSYLRAAGASALAVAIAGCGGVTPGTDDDRRETETATTTEAGTTDSPTADETDDGVPTEGPAEYRGLEFDTVLDAERDLRMDANGNRPIDGKLMEVMSEDRTLLRLRPGRYKFHDEHIIERRVSNIGIVGVGDSHRDVVFWTPEDAGRKFLNVREGGSGFLMENVTFDHMDGPGSIGSTLRMQDHIRVHDVEHVGFNPTDNNGAIQNLSPQVLDPDGTAVVDGFVRTGPTDITSHGSHGDDANEGAIWLADDHEGSLVIRDCHIENTGTNAVYVRSAPGDITVENCLFRNNNQTSLRIGGEGTVVRNCRFEVDVENPNHDRMNPEDWINPNAILYETGDRGTSGGLIENCEFVYRSAPEKTQAAIWADGSAGGFTIRNTPFRIAVPSVTAMRIDDPENARLGVTVEKPWDVTISGVVIEASEEADETMLRITGRPDSVVDGCCFAVPDARGVIEISKSPDTAVRNLSVSQEVDLDDSVDVVRGDGSSDVLLRDIEVTSSGCGLTSEGNSTPDVSSTPEGN